MRSAALSIFGALLLATACGGEAAPSVSPSPSPSGGPVPSELAGTWTQVADHPFTLNLTGTSYTIFHPEKEGAGDVVVNGSEIDFFNAVMSGCYDVGRYKWQVSTGLLLFTDTNSDTCTRAAVLRDSKGWRRSP